MQTWKSKKLELLEKNVLNLKRLRMHAPYRGSYEFAGRGWCQILLMHAPLHNLLQNTTKTGYWKLIFSSLFLNVDNECKTHPLIWNLSWEDFINGFRRHSDSLLNFQVLNFETFDFDLSNAVFKVSTSHISPVGLRKRDHFYILRFRVRSPPALQNEDFKIEFWALIFQISDPRKRD